MHNPIENIRQSYKPDHIRTLFVGESSPASENFFYFGNTLFTKCTRKAFERAHNFRFISDRAFLDYFKRQGCFLDDLSHEPVDHLKGEHRNNALKNSALSLAMRMQIYQPDVIIVWLKKIEPYVREAIRISDIQSRFYTLPFPGNDNQNEYIEGLIRIISDAPKMSD
jgi:hypothetical protein